MEFTEIHLKLVSCRLLPVVDSVLDYCHEIKRLAQQHNIRVEIDTSGNRLNKLIRTAEIEKIPFTAIVGEKELSNRSISLRGRKSVELGSMDLAVALDKFKSAIETNGEFKV